MKIIGLTGNSGSGKSYVAEQLCKDGAFIIDADVIARQVLMPGGAAYDDVIRSFGGCIVNTDGTINRRLLGNIVFTNAEKRVELEHITHGHIVREIKQLIESVSANPGDYSSIVIDAPLLIESGLHKITDEVWLVDADADVRLKRIMERDGLTEAEVLARFGSQTPMNELAKYAHKIIKN